MKAKDVPSKGGGEYMEGAGDFEEMSDYDAIQEHTDSTETATDDPTYTRRTVNQNVRSGRLMDEEVKLPSYDGKGLSNADYHKAAGGGDIPMTYGP